MPRKGENLLKQYIYRLQKDHNLSIDEFYSLIAEQNNCCAACKRPFLFPPFTKLTSSLIRNESIVIDHDHGCCPEAKSCYKCRRGLLHRKCNFALGVIKDDPDILLGLAEYIKGQRALARPVFRALEQNILLQVGLA